MWGCLKVAYHFWPVARLLVCFASSATDWQWGNRIIGRAPGRSTRSPKRCLWRLGLGLACFIRSPCVVKRQNPATGDDFFNTRHGSHTFSFLFPVVAQSAKRHWNSKRAMGEHGCIIEPLCQVLQFATSFCARILGQPDLQGFPKHHGGSAWFLAKRSWNWPPTWRF